MFRLMGRILPMAQNRSHDLIGKCIQSRFYTADAKIFNPTADEETNVDKWIESLDDLKQKNVRFVQNEVKIIL